MKIRKFLSAIVAVAMIMAGTSTSAFAAGTFKSDTNSNFSVKPGASYTFKITANGTTSPTFALGTSGVFTSKLTGRNGRDYFYKISAVGKSGASTGVYVSSTRVCVASVYGNGAEEKFKSDTNSNFSVKPNASYTFKITANGTPTFTLGTGGVFTSKLTGRNGNDYFYKITATGKSGTATGVYVSGTRVCVASISGNSTVTVAIPKSNTAYKDYTRPFNVDAILKDMIAAGEARGMVYTPEFGVDEQGNPLGHCGYRMPGDTLDYGTIDYDDPTFDYSYWLHKNCMDAVTHFADDAVNIGGTSQGVRFKPMWVSQGNGEYLIYVLYG